jgi:hypothetical protein
MKSSEKKKLKTLEHLLVSAFRREQESPFEIGAEWQARVMSLVRRLEPSAMRARPNGLTVAVRQVWRFAAVAAAVGIILFITYLVSSPGATTEYELVERLMEDTDRLIIFQP